MKINETVMKEEKKQRIEAAEKRELLWTEKRIAYNDSWPSQGIWYSDVQKSLDNWLREHGLVQLFETIKLSDTSRDVLYKQAKFNKLVSGIMDIYDELPYRPDNAFDIAWRSLEILMTHHKNIAWPDDNDKTAHLMSRTAKELTLPLIEKDQRVCDMVEAFLADMPLSVLRYAIIRCYIKHDLAINTHIEKVSKRAENIMGNALYEDIKKQYKLEEEVKPDADVERRASLLLQKILKGDQVTVNGNEHQMNIENRLMFILSCILFTHRCERFHGDYFSPFKSDRASLDTYAFSYYALSFCYIYFWMILYMHCKWKKIEGIVTLESIIAAAKTIQERLIPLIKEGKQ